MMTADEIVTACGGTNALASALELTPSTVSSWRTTNHIPRWWREKVVQAAEAAGAQIGPTDFPVKSRKVA